MTVSSMAITTISVQVASSSKVLEDVTCEL